MYLILAPPVTRPTMPAATSKTSDFVSDDVDTSQSEELADDNDGNAA